MGTSTPVPVVACGPTLNGTSGVNSTMYIDFAVTGGTAGTDGCYVTAAVPQNLAANCVAASRLPMRALRLAIFCLLVARAGGTPFSTTPPSAAECSLAANGMRSARAA